MFIWIRGVEWSSRSLFGEGLVLDSLRVFVLLMPMAMGATVGKPFGVKGSPLWNLYSGCLRYGGYQMVVGNSAVVPTSSTTPASPLHTDHGNQNTVMGTVMLCSLVTRLGTAPHESCL